MATTNFVQHNPTAANQEPDAAFDSNSLTTGGIGVDAIMPSDWMNKRWYQDSTMIAALAQMLATKGYSTSDANISTLASVLSNIVTNNDLKPAQITVPYSATPTFDASRANGFRIDLGGNVNGSFIINGTPGQIVTFFIVSRSPGNFSFAWPGNVQNAGNVQTQSIGNLFTQSFITDGGNWFAMENWLQNVLSGKQNALGFNPVQQGGGAGQGTNKVFIGWDGGGLKAQVDGTDLGRFLFSTGNGGNLSGNGWVSIPVGGQNLIIQWATGFMQSSQAQIQQVVNFPISFPNACFMVMPGTLYQSGDNADLGIWQTQAFNNSNATMNRGRSSHITVDQTSAPLVIAIGF